MPILSATGLSLVDIFVLGVIVIGLPLEALLTLKKSRAELASGKPGVRVKHYTQTIFLLWAVALPILILWAASDRNWADLGFTLQGGTLALFGGGRAGLIATVFLFQYSMVARSASARAQLQDAFSKSSTMTNFMPQTEDEKHLFHLLGTTAGITEEIIFRGYLIWAFSLFAPLWAAALASLFVFTILHLYQGARQLPGVFAMGALVTLVFVLSGSIWPAIAIHIFVDVINNSMVWKARPSAIA